MIFRKNNLVFHKYSKLKLICCFLVYNRESLPHDYLNYMGVANLESSTRKRTAFVDKVKSLVEKLFVYASPDLAADQVRFSLWLFLLFRVRRKSLFSCPIDIFFRWENVSCTTFFLPICPLTKKQDASSRVEKLGTPKTAKSSTK